MNNPTIPLTERALRFALGMFQDMTHTRDTTACARKAAAARAAAATSQNPLLCLARAAWWAAVAEHRAATETSGGILTGAVGRASRGSRS